MQTKRRMPYDIQRNMNANTSTDNHIIRVDKNTKYQRIRIICCFTLSPLSRILSSRDSSLTAKLYKRKGSTPRNNSYCLFKSFIGGSSLMLTQSNRLQQSQRLIMVVVIIFGFSLINVKLARSVAVTFTSVRFSGAQRKMKNNVLMSQRHGSDIFKSL